MNLNEIANLAFNQVFPEGGDETSINIEEFKRTAFSEFAYQTLLMAWKEMADTGYFEVPSYLLSETKLDVVNNEMDISSLKVFKSLPQDVWLSSIGNNCECKYVKSTANLTQLLCDDDSLPDTTKTYFILGKKIKFPKGVHATPLSITYANIGDTVTGDIECDEAIGALVRERLNNIYLGKVPPADVTNNTNPNV